MARSLLSITAATLLAVVSAVTAPVDVVTVNSEGGVAREGGVKFDWGLGDFMITYLGSTLIDSTGIDGSTMSDQASVALAVGNTVYWGDGEYWEPNTATYADFTSIENTGGSTGSGSFTSTFTAGDYILTCTGSYTFPRKYVTITTTVVIPPSHTPGEKVIFYGYMDNGSVDDDEYDNTPSFITMDPLIIGSYVPFPPDNYKTYQVAFAYVSGQPWTGWNVGMDECGISAGGCGLIQDYQDPSVTVDFGDDVGPDTAGDYSKVVYTGGFTDSGAAFSVFMGDAPGTYTTVWNVQLAPQGELMQAPVRAYAEIVAYWIGFAAFLLASLAFLFMQLLTSAGKFKALLVIALLLNATAALAYLTAVLTDSTFALGCGGRAFEWLRYAAWAVQAPLTISMLAVLAGVPLIAAVWPAALSTLAVLALFAAAVSPICISAWPLFAFAIAVGIVLLAHLYSMFAASATVYASLKGTLSGAIFAFAFCWVGYCIVWGVSEGGKVTSTAQEIITYAVLDILTKAIIPAMVVMNARSVIAYGHALAWLGVDASGSSLDFSIKSA